MRHSATFAAANLNLTSIQVEQFKRPDMLPSVWRERVKALNASPNTRFFEVGVSGTVVGGDIGHCTGTEDAYPINLSGLRPGVWHISFIDDRSESLAVLLRWVAPGPINFDNLPSTLPNPTLVPLSPLQRVADYVVDGGIHGLFDRDSLFDLIRVERHDREYVLEAISDYWLWGRNLAVQIGFVVGSADGLYRIMARKHDGFIVELSTIPDV